MEPSVYPNPFSAWAVVDLKIAMENAELQVFDRLGRSALTIKDINGREIHIDGRRLAAVVYFYRVTSNNQALTGRLIVR